MRLFDRFFECVEGPTQRIPKPSRPLSETASSGWDLDMVLFRYSNGDPFLLRDACEGVSILGTNGSGKSSGSGRTLAISYLKKGFGGLVLCEKEDEADRWRDYARLAGREPDIVEVRATAGEVFPAINFLDYEMRRPGGGETRNIVELFVSLGEVAQRAAGQLHADAYWKEAMKTMLTNAVELLKLAKGSCSLIELDEIISAAPHDLEDAGSDLWRNGDASLNRPPSSLWCYLEDARAKSQDDSDKAYEFRQTEKYWLHTYPSIPEKQRAGFVEIFRTIANNFLRGKVRKLFCGGTTLTPEHTYADGGIIIVNTNYQEFGEVGRLCNAVWLYLTMAAIERRPKNEGDLARPVFIWMDEAQEFLMEACQRFQAKARSTRGCAVALSQNIPNYQAKLGPNAKAYVDSWLGNLNTKVFHANSDSVTNQWATELISKSKQMTSNYSMGHGFNQSPSMSISETVDYDCPPSTFLTLLKGGPGNGCRVEGIVQMTGRGFSTKRTWFKAVFDQNYE